MSSKTKRRKKKKFRKISDLISEHPALLSQRGLWFVYIFYMVYCCVKDKKLYIKLVWSIKIKVHMNLRVCTVM